jgi:hypothetical protein
MAVRMDAVGDFLLGSTNVPSGAVSASFWLYETGTTPTTDWFVWGIGGNTSSLTDAYGLWGNPSARTLTLYGPGAVSICTTAALTINTWTFVALAGNTGASQSWTVWLNATAYTGTSGASTAYLAGLVDLGASVEFASAWSDGRFAAYKHWTATLTTAQIQAERWTYLPQRWDQLWACCPLLHTGALGDLTGQGHGFAPTGTPTTEDGPALAWGSHAPMGQWYTGGPSVAPAAGKAPPPRRQPWRFMRRAA